MVVNFIANEVNDLLLMGMFVKRDLLRNLHLPRLQIVIHYQALNTFPV